MGIEFLQWKEVFPFIKYEAKRGYFPFRSPFVFLSSKHLISFSKIFGKIYSFFDRFLHLFNFKVFNIALKHIFFFVFSLLVIFYFILNAKVGHDMGVKGATLAIPGVTLPILSIYGMLVAVIVHEFGHAGVMIEQGYPPQDIGLLFLLVLPVGAGVRPSPDFEKTSPAIVRAKVFSAGIFMNFLAVIASFPLLIYAREILWSNFWTEVMFWVFIINLGIALFNLLVIPPLDGYHIFKALAEESIQDPLKRKVFLGGSISLSVFLLLLNLGLIGLFLK